MRLHKCSDLKNKLLTGGSQMSHMVCSSRVTRIFCIFFNKKEWGIFLFKAHKPCYWTAKAFLVFAIQFFSDSIQVSLYCSPVSILPEATDCSQYTSLCDVMKSNKKKFSKIDSLKAKVSGTFTVRTASSAF